MGRLSVTYNGLTVGGSSQYSINKLEGINGMGVRVSEDLLTGANGGNIWNSLYDMRSIAFEGNFHGTDIDDFFTKKQALIDAFQITTSTDLTITVWDSTATTRLITAKVVLTPMIIHVSGRTNFADWRVELRCEDPYFGDTSTTVYNLSLIDDASVGFPLQALIPFNLGRATGASNKVINNTGDIDWYLENIKFAGTVVTPRLTNLTNGDAIYLNDTLGAAEYVNISKTQQGFFATDNTGANVLANVLGDYPLIETGNNQMQFSAASYSATAACALTWRNKYSSI